MPDPGDTPTTVALVAGDGTEVITARVDARSPDLALVDALARLQLVARRCGWTMLVHDAPADLRGLIDLVGLADVLRIEVRREAERSEQLGIEEVVEADDPPA